MNRDKQATESPRTAELAAPDVERLRAVADEHDLDHGARHLERDEGVHQPLLRGAATAAVKRDMCPHRGGAAVRRDDDELTVPVEPGQCYRLAAQQAGRYFVGAEALTNAVKHLQAREVSLDVDLDGDTLVVEVRDDGVGGADPARGTGLTCLVDRVDAAGRALSIRSPTGEGTTVRAPLPLG